MWFASKKHSSSSKLMHFNYSKTWWQTQKINLKKNQKNQKNHGNHCLQSMKYIIIQYTYNKSLD